VNSLKHSPILVNDEEICANALAYGLSPERAWLMADWIAGANAFISVEEADVAERIKAMKVARAAGTRRGRHVAVAGEERVTDFGPETPVASGRGEGVVGSSIF